jgi:hypothetical protein
MRVALTLTGAWAFLLLLRVLGGVKLRSGVADVLQFTLVVTYVVGVPIACGLAARLGDRPTRRVKMAVGLIFIWLAFLVWAATLSF